MTSFSRERMRQYMREYREKRLKAARVKLGGKCVLCWSEANLEFDHIDPTTRIKPITTLTHASKKVFDAELAKCQLLCVQCHDRKTILERGHVPVEHGRASMYQHYGCRCLLCKEVGSRYNKGQRGI